MVLVLVGGLVGGLFGREGGGCRGVGGGGGLWGVLGASGGGRKGPGERRGDGVRVGSALRKDDIQEAPSSNQIESPGGFLRLQVHESRHRKRIVPLGDTAGRNLGPQITTQRNPECRRLFPVNSNPAPIFARNDLRHCKPAYVPW